MTSARASATRCCWPPDSSSGIRGPNPARSNKSQHLVDIARNVGGGVPADLQAVGDVFPHGQMREQGVVLKDEANVAPVGRNGR